MISEDNLINWSKPASDAEEKRCLHTIECIKASINKHNFGVMGTPIVKLRGSFENNTNVKRSSDVDMYVLFEDFCYSCTSNFEKLPSSNHLGVSFNSFKNELYNALKNDYGYTNVTLGNKSIKIDSLVKADVVPVVKLFSPTYPEGVSFLSQSGEFIINYPEQDNKNGKNKNIETNYAYKKFVRIFKVLANNLYEKKIINKIPSFVIESLLFNVPNYYFCGENNTKIAKNIIAWLRYNINNYPFKEVNNIKMMFSPNVHPEQKTTRTEIASFLLLLEAKFMNEAA